MGINLERIRRTSKDKLVVCFNGVGSAFAKENTNTSLIVAYKGETVLIDCGSTVPFALHRHGIKVTDFDYYYFTHAHADHVGGVEELLYSSLYVAQKKPHIIISEQFQEQLWEKTLRGGMELTASHGRMHFDSYATFHRPEMLGAVTTHFNTPKGIQLIFFPTKHVVSPDIYSRVMHSTGVIINHKVVYTGDMMGDPEVYSQNALYFNVADAIFHDCQLTEPSPVHTSWNFLKNEYPEHLKSRTHLVHLQDNRFSILEDPTTFGFAGYTIPWYMYCFDYEH